MRKTACVSVRGTAHKTNGLPCQDFSLVAQADCGGGTVVCALADGAGSAKYAAEGAQLSCEVSVEYFQRQLSDHPRPADLIVEYDRSDGRALVQLQHERLAAFAAERKAEISDFSTTLLVAVIHEDVAAF